MSDNNYSLVTQTPTTITNPSGLLVGNYGSLSGGTSDVPKLTTINGAPVSVILELQSTTGAFLLPRMTTTQRNALVTPANGMVIYNSTIDLVQFYEAGLWVSAGTGGGGVSSVSGTAAQILASPTTGDVIVSLIATAVTPGSYTNTSLTVDAYGRITAASSGTAGVTSITGTANEITASASTGAITLSIPSTFIAPGTIQATTSSAATSFLINGATDGVITIKGQLHAGTYEFDMPTTAGTSGYLLTSAGGAGSPMIWTNPNTIGGVTSIAGTANQITASASTGAITLSIPNTFIAPGTVAVGNLELTGNTLESTNTNGNINLTPNGVGINVLANAQVTSLSALQIVTTDGSKNLVSTADLGVALGGTGNTTFTAYSVICAGTTATGAFQNVSGVGTSGQVLTSNGASALPTWQASAGGVTSIAGTANQINASASTGAITLTLSSTIVTPGTLTVNAAFTQTAGIANIGADATDNAINIGTGASTGRLITIGNTTLATGVAAYIGTGNYIVDGVGASTYTFGPSTTTGTFVFGGTAQTGLITIGSSSATSTISIGNGAGATTVNIANNASTGAVNISAAATTATISIGGGAQTGLITLGSSTGTNTIAIGSGIGAGTINIGAGAIAVKTVNIGTGASANVVTVGTTNGAASLTLNAGSAGITMGGVAGVTVANQAFVTINTSTGALGSSTTNLGVLVIQSSSTATLAPSHEYICNNGASLITFTLPATAALGDTYEIIGGSSGGWIVAQNAGQTMHSNSSATTTGATGSLASTSAFNCIEIICTTTNTGFTVIADGSLTIV